MNLEDCDIGDGALAALSLRLLALGELDMLGLSLCSYAVTDRGLQSLGAGPAPSASPFSQTCVR